MFLQKQKSKTHENLCGKKDYFLIETHFFLSDPINTEKKNSASEYLI